MFRDYTKYEVFENGQIWSYKTKRFLKPATDTSGYQFVKLSNNEGKQKTYRVHRIVYEAVTGEPIPSDFEINHLDEDKTNNFFANLNLLTHKENCNFGTRNIRARKAKINGVLSKQVGAFKNGEIIMSFQSIAEAHRQGFNKGNVVACCKGERKTHKGYTWKYL